MSDLAVEEKSKNMRLITDAIWTGDLERLNEILDGDNELLHAKTYAGTWLHMAVAKGQLEIVKYLIGRGISINARDFHGRAMPLWDAATKNQYEIAVYLLDQGAVMDVSERLANPLFTAIRQGHVEMAKLLIDRGIDTSVKYNCNKWFRNEDAKKYAKYWGQKEIVELLSK